MTPDQRAAWLASARAILDACQAHPDLPVPYISRQEASFYLAGEYSPDPAATLNAAETALAGSLGVTFASPGGPGDDYYYNLTAVMPGGLPVTIKAIASEVAERKVTGQAVTEVTEWVRRPAGKPGATGQGESEMTQ